MLQADQVNDKIERLISRSESDLQKEMNRLGIGGSQLKKSVKTRATIDKNTGLIKRIRYTFKKEGVFVHKGVGRGTKASQVGSTKRQAKEWFNPVVEKAADDMAEAAADGLVELTFKKLRID